MDGLFLECFEFPRRDREEDFLFELKETCFDTIYPFFTLSKHQFERVDFERVTIFYGGNGSGKTTALNVIAEKIHATRDSLFNQSNFFQQYVDLCQAQGNMDGSECRIITSDDVFDFMLQLREVNAQVDQRREELRDEYYSVKNSKFKMRSLDDYDTIKKINMARSKTKSKYVRANVMDNVREHSNGESAFIYFTDKIKENGLYLLDEPENSLSPERQQELLQFLEDSSRFFGCQFIIATHSPFLLSLRGAKIYDMDEEPVDVKRWTQLGNVRSYYDFFKKHEREFH